MCEECKVSRVHKTLMSLRSEVDEGKTVCAYPSKKDTYLVFKRGNTYVNTYEKRLGHNMYTHKTVENVSFEDLSYTMYMIQECDSAEDAIWFVVDASMHQPCKECKTFSGIGLEDGMCLWCCRDQEREAFNKLLADIEINL